MEFPVYATLPLYYNYWLKRLNTQLNELWGRYPLRIVFLILKIECPPDSVVRLGYRLGSRALRPVVLCPERGGGILNFSKFKKKISKRILPLWVLVDKQTTPCPNAC